jgi:hypothetical protein
MGWNDHNDRWLDMTDEAEQLADYYTQLSGTSVQVGVENNLEEFWIRSNRTNDMEYFGAIEEADRRLRQLYEELLPDDGDYSDPYEGL